MHDHNSKLRTTPTTTKGLPKSLVTLGITKPHVMADMNYYRQKKKPGKICFPIRLNSQPIESRVFRIIKCNLPRLELDQNE